ncbi:MAG: hypothetical protein AABZ64_10220 [Nitrospinota bacterium]
MSEPKKCPFLVALAGGELICFDPWFCRAIRRGPRVVQDFCQRDFRACPFYRVQDKPAGIKAALA